MNVQGFQKMTLLDFPGKVACTVFTGGCNMRCPFCHNAGLVLAPNEYGNMADEVLEFLPKRVGLLDGVCITGGEPLLQPDVVEFIKKIKEFQSKLGRNSIVKNSDKISNNNNVTIHVIEFFSFIFYTSSVFR